MRKVIYEQFLYMTYVGSRRSNMLNNSFPTRKAVNKSETWDISAIFSSDENFKEAIKQLEKIAKIS